MTLPGHQAWIFSAKTFAAAMLALVLAQTFDLPRPYWAVATVYITSQLLAGATRSKAVYRVGGTLLGAVAAVVFVPNLVNAPELLCLAVALWVGLCLYLSLLDRTPRSYLFMLGGYTAALIGFPAVAEPQAMFETAVARAEEITLGILCASLVSTQVLPRPVAPVVAARLDAWLGDARRLALAAFEGRADPDAGPVRLAADAVALEAFATHLAYDSGARPGAVRALAALRQHMLMFLPILSAIADRVAALEAGGGLDRAGRRVLADLGAWLRMGGTDPDEARRLARMAADAAPPHPATWDELLRASLMLRLRDFIDLRQDIRALRREVLDGRTTRVPPAFRHLAAPGHVRHRDHGMALRSALGVTATILLTCAIWIATGWPDGSGAPMMAAVACCFYATLDDPAPAIMGFATSAIIGAAVGGLYLFALLPLATNIESVILLLMPAYLVCGALMQEPRTAPLATGAAVNGSTLLALQSTYSADFPAFANAAVAVIVGMWVAALVTRLLRSVDAGWSARRLRLRNRATLLGAARRVGYRDGAGLSALMLDRLGLLAPRLVALPPDDLAGTADLVAEVRAAMNLAELRRGRSRLPAGARRAVDRVLDGLPDHAAGNTRPLLGWIDAALDATAPGPGTDEPCGEACLGLVGLRRALFPDALPYRACARDPEPLERAA
ncbi:FUSC family protein [Methylobacterium nigriterrae]|uniref:FUSC family protein n=1 Tax=Methylobacterium nigriterrae TaxID=3127512 RepID=UPI00301413C3